MVKRIIFDAKTRKETYSDDGKEMPSSEIPLEHIEYKGIDQEKLKQILLDKNIINSKEDIE